MLYAYDDTRVFPGKSLMVLDEFVETLVPKQDL